MKTLKYVALVLAVALVGCGRPDPKVAQAISVFECKARILQPYLGDLTQQVVAEAMAGTLDAGTLLLNLGVKAPELLELGKAWIDCNPIQAAPLPAAPTSAS